METNEEKTSVRQACELVHAESELAQDKETEGQTSAKGVDEDMAGTANWPTCVVFVRDYLTNYKDLIRGLDFGQP